MGDRGGEEFEKLRECSVRGPLLLNVVKLYSKADCMSFDALARVVSGTLS